MQYTLRIITKNTQSLRATINRDERSLARYELVLLQEKSNARDNGWSKLRMAGESGVINYSWDPASSTLTARCISKKRNNPNLVMAQFIWYLMDRFQKKIHSIILVP